MSSLQRRFGLPTDLTPSVLLIVHVLSFIQAMCPAHLIIIMILFLKRFSMLNMLNCAVQCHVHISPHKKYAYTFWDKNHFEQFWLKQST